MAELIAEQMVPGKCPVVTLVQVLVGVRELVFTGPRVAYQVVRLHHALTDCQAEDGP